MKNLQLKTIALVLLIVSFFMPQIGTMLLSAGAPAEAKQYDGLQLILMGAYNAPFLIVSLVALLVGRSFQKKLKVKASTIAYVISIISSVAGILLMLTWTLGAS